MYMVKTDNQYAILYRIKKDGDLVEQCRTIDGKTLMLPKYKKDSLIFKSKCNIELLLIGSTYIADITDKIKVYIKPHYQELHRVIMTESYNRYSLANVRYKQKMGVDFLELDDKGILNNMLEFIGEI